MDHPQYSTFWAAVREVPDPRHARGQRYPWPMLLAILCAGLASGHKTVWAIAQWAQLHAREWQVLWREKARALPSASTLYRAMGQVDIQALEAHLQAYGQQLQQAQPPRHPFRALAVDGKELRGASQHGAPVHLISLVDQEQGVVLQQLRIPEGTNEQGALAQLLQGRSWQGMVLTLDAMYTTRSLAQHILQQGGHYLMVVKGNQPSLEEALQTYFQAPALTRGERHEHQTYERVHGRQEWRRVVASEALNTYLDWPGVGQVLQRTCRRHRSRDKGESLQTRYAITSLRSEQASVRVLAQLWRGHWCIENRTHYVRDDTMGEDRNQMRRGHSPQALAALRNGLMNAFRQQGFHSIATALRTHAARLDWSLQALGIIPPSPILQDLPTF